MEYKGIFFLNTLTQFEDSERLLYFFSELLLMFDMKQKSFRFTQLAQMLIENIQ